MHTPYKIQPMQENFNGYSDWTTANIRDNRNCHVLTIGEVDHATGKESREFADFIVTACNSHARLVGFAQLVADFFANDSAGHAQYLREQALNTLAEVEKS